MLKLHWTVWSIVIICLIAVLVLIFEAMFQNKTIPEGALAIFSSIATSLIGYGAGKGEK